MIPLVWAVEAKKIVHWHETEANFTRSKADDQLISFLSSAETNNEIRFTW